MPQGTFIDVLRRHAFKSPADPFTDDGLDEAPYGIEPLRILVSPLAGDNQRLAARHIHDRLAGRLGVSVSIADRPLTVPGGDYSQPLFGSMAIELGRRWLQRESADLLIWGENISTYAAKAPKETRASWRLRFLGGSTPLHPQSATMSALERLEVPELFDDATGDLVFGAALAAINVESAEGVRARAGMFRPVLHAATHFAEGDMEGTVAEGATAQSAYAALLLLEGARTSDVKMLERAVSVYQGVLILGEDAFTEHEQAMIGSHISDALSLIGEIAERPKLADKTIEYYRAALSMVRKEVFTDEYAALNVRLGLALHGQALSTGETLNLKEATDAFSAATSIWTITDAPERWADIQNSLGGLLVTMGELTQQPSLFDKAVTVFLKIVQVRSRTKAPLAWATTLAHIGAALKEKGIAAENTECLKQAAEAFDRACQVFIELNLDINAELAANQREAVLKLLAEQP